MIGGTYIHQAAKYLESVSPNIRNASTQSAGDGQKTAKTGLPVYSFDEQHVDKHTPGLMARLFLMITFQLLKTYITISLVYSEMPSML